MHILRLLALAALSVSCASCVSDDWYDDDDDYYYDGDYGYGRRRYDAYDDGYERGRRDGERYERERRERDRARYDRDRRQRDARDRDRDRDHNRRDREAPVSVKTPKGYVLAGSFQAGDAVECGIPTSNKIKTVRIVATSGTISVNTVVLREGPAKTPFPVTRRLSPGEAAEVALGGHRKATGLRISAGGKGSYNVYVH